jgi:hypothetical protein
MGREKLEGILDELFSRCLNSPAFLEQCIGELTGRPENDDWVVRVKRLASEITNLRQKRAVASLTA